MIFFFFVGFRYVWFVYRRRVKGVVTVSVTRLSGTLRERVVWKYDSGLSDTRCGIVDVIFVLEVYGRFEFFFS